MAASDALDPEVVKKMNCFYPSYIDSTLTRPQGRRIPTESAVEHPHIMECVEVFKTLGIPFVLENKTYSRDILRVGRIKYSMSPVGGDKPPLAANKREFLKIVAAGVPKLKSRTSGPAAVQDGKSSKAGKKKKK
eukprot:TRINITY_DN7313_c0_g1_i1.p1 TRINITY_DN7313_c0_g1~~TRINITY_DN7313_c0_g1_i1.p1  ORF type:complete len:134 (-),score=30.40 TRINITY_DN7313_c0_g1_i1:186-587(-)